MINLSQYTFIELTVVTAIIVNPIEVLFHKLKKTCDKYLLIYFFTLPIKHKQSGITN